MATVTVRWLGICCNVADRWNIPKWIRFDHANADLSSMAESAKKRYSVPSPAAVLAHWNEAYSHSPSTHCEQINADTFQIDISDKHCYTLEIQEDSVFFAASDGAPYEVFFDETVNDCEEDEDRAFDPRPCLEISMGLVIVDEGWEKGFKKNALRRILQLCETRPAPTYEQLKVDFCHSDSQLRKLLTYLQDEGYVYECEDRFYCT